MISGTQRLEQHIEFSYDPDSPLALERIQQISTENGWIIEKASPGHIVAFRYLPWNDDYNALPGFYELDEVKAWMEEKRIINNYPE